MELGTTEAGLGNARRESAKAEKSRRDRFIVCFPFVKYLPDDPNFKSPRGFCAIFKRTFSFVEPVSLLYIQIPRFQSSH